MLVLKSISSTTTELEIWEPELDEVFISLDLEIGWSGKEGADFFYVTLVTPESLRKNIKEFLLVENRTLVVSEYDYLSLLSAVNKILQKCSKGQWKESCDSLMRYFQWEYEDYVADDLH